MKPESLLQCSQEPTISAYSESDESSLYLSILFSMILILY
jgi:hypothetical protein